MRVCCITSLVTAGENSRVASFVSTEVAALRSQGHDITVVTPIDEHGKRRGAWYCVRKARRLVAANEARVVHIHYGSLLGCLAALAFRGVPKVLTLHGSDALGHRYATWHRPVEALRLWLGVLLTQVAVCAADVVIAVSERVKDALFVGRAKTTVIPCGVDFEAFQPMDVREARQVLGLSCDAKLVLFASPSRREKNYPLAQEAVAFARAVDPRIEMLVLENVSPARVFHFINAADVVLVTSLSEGSPVITKEALACDVPVVSVDVGDMADQLNSIPGCFVGPYDPAELGAAIVRAVAAKPQFCGRTASRRFDARVTAANITELYATVAVAKPGDCRASTYVPN